MFFLFDITVHFTIVLDRYADELRYTFCKSTHKQKEISFLEAQLLSNWIDVTDSVVGRLALLAISPLIVARFGRSLRFCNLEFGKEAIPDGFVAHSRVFRGRGGLILSDFRELSF